MTDLLLTMLVPLLIMAVALWGAVRRVDVYAALVTGAGEGRFAVEHHAVMFGLLARAVLEVCGESGREIVKAGCLINYNRNR